VPWRFETALTVIVNPEHLEAVRHSENCQRGVDASGEA
jgi:hypothetical protein